MTEGNVFLTWCVFFKNAPIMTLKSYAYILVSFVVCTVLEEINFLNFQNPKSFIQNTTQKLVKSVKITLIEFLTKSFFCHDSFKSLFFNLEILWLTLFQLCVDNYFSHFRPKWFMTTSCPEFLLKRSIVMILDVTASVDVFQLHKPL